MRNTSAACASRGKANDASHLLGARPPRRARVRLVRVRSLPLAVPACEVVVIAGDTRGLWTLVRECAAPKYTPKSSKRYGEFTCECGKSKVVAIAEVIAGNSRSCGCLGRSAWRRAIQGPRDRSRGREQKEEGRVKYPYGDAWMTNSSWGDQPMPDDGRACRDDKEAQQGSRRDPHLPVPRLHPLRILEDDRLRVRVQGVLRARGLLRVRCPA